MAHTIIDDKPKLKIFKFSVKESEESIESTINAWTKRHRASVQNHSVVLVAGKLIYSIFFVIV